MKVSMYQQGVDNAPMSATARKRQYYDLDKTQLSLYNDSKEGKVFKNLLELIVSDENILLAYRNIKTNDGAKTKGTDKENIINLSNKDQTELLDSVRKSLLNYKPNCIKRVWIPKPNGKLRPLGIPTIRDRLIQQMFKQILEPICEAKFYKDSYGFRPLRGTHHAVARMQTLININKLYYTVDIDIKGFFDNVDHNLLIKQMWNIGIRDKRVLAIIGKMLKAPIRKEGIPTKGVPQGGILSPLLSNIVLNDLDQWVANQWESFETKKTYAGNDTKIRALKTTHLKEGYIVRYADDFRIMTRSYKMAERWFHAVRLYLKDRLKLEISPEKSKIINLRKKSSEFLGYKIKATLKGNKVYAKTNVSENKLKDMQNKLKELIKNLNKKPSPENVRIYNATVLGMQQAFKYATHVRIDFHKLEYKLKSKMHLSLRKRAKFEIPHIENYGNSTYIKLYGNNTKKTYVFKSGTFLYPISKIKTTNNMNFSHKRNPYVSEQNYSWDVEIIKLMRSRIAGRSTEYMDNRLSVFSMQKGLCAVTKLPLTAELVHCHHKTPKHLGGDDSFRNLIIVHKFIHVLIHATKPETISKYVNMLKLNVKQVKAINSLRAKCKLENIKLT